ncbi:hypothetical protein N9E12_00120 [Candidatus Marinimicrobia bacterium]|nr:hypothetical protein [Candidatus Neomarinimicrobiota bacterium]
MTYIISIFKQMIMILFCFFYGCSVSINNGKNLSKNNKTEFFTTKGEVIISHIKENEWIFDYKLDKKIKMIMLGPQTKKYHETSWRLPSAFEIMTDSKTNYSYLKRKDTKSFDKVSISVSTYADIILYAPQPFIVYEQGVGVNTGPIGYATKVGFLNLMNNFSPTYFFKTMLNENIIVPGNPNISNSITQTQRKNLIAYFGDKEAMHEGDYVVSIIDKKFPRQLEKAYKPFVDKCVSLYNKKLGIRFDQKLNIFLSHTLWDKEGYGFGGGAQEFQILAKSFGDGSEIGKIEIKKMQLFFAHEMAHLWQTDLGNDNFRWFHEGGAELMSYYVLKELGLISEEDILKMLSENLKQSIEGLSEVSLEFCHINDYPKLNYTAGLLLTHASIIATNANDNINDIFKLEEILSTFGKNDRINKPFDVFSQALVTLGAKKESVETIQSFIKTKHKNPILAYEELFRITGVKYIKKNENIKITGL